MDLGIVVVDCFYESKKSLLKTRRLVIRRMRWRNDEWYVHWPEIAETLICLL